MYVTSVHFGRMFRCVKGEVPGSRFADVVDKSYPRQNGGSSVDYYRPL